MRSFVLYAAAVLAFGSAVRAEDPPAAAPAPQPAALYRLRNAAAADVSQALRAHLDGQKAGARVAFDAASNTVYVQASAAIQERVAKLVEKIDAAPPQVMIQALVAEVPAGFLSDIGMTDDAPGCSVLTLTPREVSMLQVQIRKAKERDCIDILARPQFTAFDNQSAWFRMGGDVPYLTTTAVNAEGVTTQAVQYQPVGVTLRVTPRINPDGKVLMRVEPQVTSVSPTPVNLGNGITGPAFNSQTVQATVQVADGQTVILRGMHVPASRPNPDDGPFTALAKKLTADQKREVLFILTPHVVRSEAAKPAAQK